MLKSHNKILPLESIHYGPFYDQATILNRATHDWVEIGAVELVPPVLDLEYKSLNILSPQFRTDMYIISMIRQLYHDIPASVVIPSERRKPHTFEIAELTHGEVSILAAKCCVTRCEFRDISIFITACTNRAGTISDNPALASYMMSAIETAPGAEYFPARSEEEEDDDGQEE